MEHSLRHCFPLNFFRMPLGVETTSPFLYRMLVVGERGVLERLLSVDCALRLRLGSRFLKGCLDLS